jgi:hypothetical protein
MFGRPDDDYNDPEPLEEEEPNFLSYCVVIVFLVLIVIILAIAIGKCI